MTKTINTHTIIGHLGADPLMRTLPSGDAVTTLRVGTSEEWIDKSTGEVKSITEWHSVALYRLVAENACQYLRKGSLVFIEGSSRTRKYQHKSTGEDRYSRTLEARVIKYLDRRSGDKHRDTDERVSEAGSFEPVGEGGLDTWLSDYESAGIAGGAKRA